MLLMLSWSYMRWANMVCTDKNNIPIRSLGCMLTFIYMYASTLPVLPLLLCIPELSGGTRCQPDVFLQWVCRCDASSTGISAGATSILCERGGDLYCTEENIQGPLCALRYPYSIMPVTGLGIRLETVTQFWLIQCINYISKTPPCMPLIDLITSWRAHYSGEVL